MITGIGAAEDHIRPELAQQAQALGQHRAVLVGIDAGYEARLRDQLDDCIGCGCLSLESCPLRNPEDIAAESGPGALLFEQVDAALADIRLVGPGQVCQSTGASGSGS